MIYVTMWPYIVCLFPCGNYFIYKDLSEATACF